ncbi:MAG TPA: hypothetical protein VJ873_05370, partial [bacterium]|nr:hypothetical protein [bacterium]
MTFRMAFWHKSFLLPRQSIPLVVFFLFTLSIPFLAGALLASPAQADSDEEQGDNPLLRDQWFMRGRRSPDGFSAAIHRYQAWLAAQNLPVTTSLSTTPGGSPSPGLAALLAVAGSCNWTELGPSPLGGSQNAHGQNVSGRVTSLVPDFANDPSGNTLYLGTAYGGIWKTTNALSASPAWTLLSQITQTLAVGAIGLDTSMNPPLIYVGTGEPNLSADSYYGTGILKSTDGGSTWTQL